MALTDAYATVAEYKSRVTQEGPKEDANIEYILFAVSRFIDLQCNRFFTQDDTVQTRLYDGGGSLPITVTGSINIENPYTYDAYSKFYLPDDISTTTGLVVMIDNDGDFTPETVLTRDTHFWLGPWNAATGPEAEPWRWLQIKPNNGLITVWPSHTRSISVTAKFGWLTPPIAIKEATIALARQMVHTQKATTTLTLQQMDALIRITPKAPNIIADIVRRYGRARRMFA